MLRSVKKITDPKCNLYVFWNLSEQRKGNLINLPNAKGFSITSKVFHSSDCVWLFYSVPWGSVPAHESFLAHGFALVRQSWSLESNPHIIMLVEFESNLWGDRAKFVNLAHLCTGNSPFWMFSYQIELRCYF